jgi:hypothetical protein
VWRTFAFQPAEFAPGVIEVHYRVDKVFAPNTVDALLIEYPPAVGQQDDGGGFVRVAGAKRDRSFPSLFSVCQRVGDRNQRTPVIRIPIDELRRYLRIEVESTRRRKFVIFFPSRNKKTMSFISSLLVLLPGGCRCMLRS